MSQIIEKKDLIIARISRIVENLKQADSLFEEKLNADEMVKVLFALVTDNFTTEQFNNLSDAELTRRFRKVMITEAVAGTLNDLTPEQIALFDQMVKRK